MKISRLLELHSQCKPQYSLPNCFGDGFLIQNNPIYKAVRVATINANFTFTTEVTNDYLVLPLSQLDEVLRNKKIPYFENVSVLNQIEKKIPNTTLWDEVSDNLKRNFLFHESCHAVSRTIADRIFLGDLDQQKNVLKLMLEESYSNTCELFGVVDVDQPAHRLFYEMSSYIYVYEDRVHLKDLINEIGRESSLKMMMMFYLHSNFQFESIDERALSRILKLLAIESKEAKKIKKFRTISRIAFQLNPRFREVTSGFYLRLNGYEANLAAFDFMHLLETDSRFIQFIESVVKIVA